MYLYSLVCKYNLHSLYDVASMYVISGLTNWIINWGALRGNYFSHS